MSDARICSWNAKFGGMDVSEARRLRTLEDVVINPQWVYAVNGMLERMLADTMLDNATLKDLLGKKG